MEEPRPSWWSSPLDVQGFALDAVEVARSAIERLARSRSMSVDVTTTPEHVAGSFSAMEHLQVDGRRPQGWAATSGFFEATDGWVRTHGNYSHHSAAIELAFHASTRIGVQTAVARLSAVEVESRVTDAGGIAAVVRSVEEWSAHPHALQTIDDPWPFAVRGGHRAVSPSSDSPLSGVRVLDLTRVIAGPTCSQLLACLGADVLRIDPPHRPELLDHYVSNAMGKRSAEVDLALLTAEARHEILSRADVVLLGYRPGSLRKYGLDADLLAAEHPGLVVASLSAWGESGPWAHRAGFDSIVQAATGIADLCRTPDGTPGALPVQALDHSTGFVLAAGVMDLLAEGYGGIVRASLLGAARSLLDRPRERHVGRTDLNVPTIEVDSPHGRLTVAPPPIVIDGRTLRGNVTGYGAAQASWLSSGGRPSSA